MGAGAGALAGVFMFGRAGPLAAGRAPALGWVAGRDVSLEAGEGVSGRESGALPLGFAVVVPVEGLEAVSCSSLSFLIPSFSRILLKRLMVFPFYGFLD
jgi:hypothetical protein